MIISVLFLAFTAGTLILHYPVVGLLLLALTWFFSRRQRFKRFSWCLIAFTVALGLSIWQNSAYSSSKLWGVVIKAADKYAVIRGWTGTFYLQTEGLAVGDIVCAYGRSVELGFRHFQESFDFKKYLLTYGARFEFEARDVTVSARNFIRPLEFKRAVLKGLDPKVQDLAASFLFGDYSESLVQKGTAQALSLFSLIQISGLHVAFVCRIFEKVFKDKLSDRRILALESALVGVIVLATNYRRSLLRLFWTRLLRFAAHDKMTKRETDALTGIIGLTLSPNSVLSVSFYVIYPLLFMLDFSSLIRKKVPVIWRPVFTGLLVYLYFLPFSLNAGYLFSFLAPVTRFLALPFAQLGFILALGAIMPGGKLLVPGLAGLEELLRALEKLPGVIVFGKPSPFLIATYYILLILALFTFELGLKKVTAGISIGLLALIVCPLLPIERGHYEVHFIDVGQGDATLVRNGGRNYLIDTGGDRFIDLASECLIPYFHRLRIRKLDAIYITHGDYDHSGALERLKSNFNVEKILFNSGDNYIKDINIFKKNDGDLNYNSAVFDFRVRQTEFLIMGDAPAAIERLILRKFDLKPDVIKLGHHGSNTSSDFDFLQKMAPQTAIISCGYQNSYGHPSPQVISYLESLNITYHRTDLEGTFVYKC